MSKEEAYNAKVVGKTMVTPNLMILRVMTDEPRKEFEAGQYTVLGLYGYEERYPDAEPEFIPAEPDKLIQRPYSIASARHQTREFEFYISLVKSGQLTPRLFNLEVGDRIYMGTRIIGAFRLNEAPRDANIVMIATGTGITPYVSFLRSHIIERPNNKMVVVQGAAHPWDLGYYSELLFLAHTFPNFYYIPTLTDADEDWPGYRLWIEELLEQGVLEKEAGIEIDPEKTHFYLCGNPKMVENVSKWLMERGYKRHRRREPGTLYVEEF